jgi:hypothetical protein
MTNLLYSPQLSPPSSSPFPPYLFLLHPTTQPTTHTRKHTQSSLSYAIAKSKAENITQNSLLYVQLQNQNLRTSQNNTTLLYVQLQNQKLKIKNPFTTQNSLLSFCATANIKNSRVSITQSSVPPKLLSSLSLQLQTPESSHGKKSNMQKALLFTWCVLWTNVTIWEHFSLGIKVFL